MPRSRLVSEMLAYLSQNKKLLLIPVLVLLALVGVVVFIAQAPALATMIYALF